MNKPSPTKAFNAACAEYMKLDVLPWHDGKLFLCTAEEFFTRTINIPFGYYDPHDNMNQLFPVLEKAAKEKNRNFLFMVDGGSFEEQARNFVSQALNITEVSE